MFAEATTHSVLMVDEPSYSVTPYSLTLVLAYLHYYTPERLPNGRFIAPKHLRLLAAWIGWPAPALRSLRQHVPLAAHMALLQAAGFLPANGPVIWAEPTVSNWLHGSVAEAIATLQGTLACSTRWQEALAGLGLQEVLREDYLVYLAQSLARQGRQGQRVASNPPEPVVWLAHEQAQTWQLCLPPSLPLWLHFDLRQLGDWQPGQPLICTPLTIATAGQRGYGREVIQWLLETATQQPLPEKQQIQLGQWSRRAHVYRLRTVRLLSVPQPEHLAVLLRRKEFRAAVIEQLSPRHAIIRTNVVATLEKWLAGQGYPLVQIPPAKEPARGMTEGTAYQWLSLRVLVGLGGLIPLPCPLPHSLLDTLGQALSDLEKAELEATAVGIVEGLVEAIHGRDAFLPAQQPVPPTLIAALQQAIKQEGTVTISYQALGDRKATYREIQPLRLEQHGKLFYLYAYCYRAESNLTFRLDRIKEIRN